MGFSKKQLEVLRFPYSGYEALICDGAVRSGKTSVMSLSFLLWAMDKFDGCNFAFCGKSVGSVERNIITPLLEVRYLQEQFSLRYAKGSHVLTVRRGGKENRIYLFGGKDESSYALIQGITLAGVLLDEAVLMPESFVNQALARCSVEGARIWFSCNPGNPNYWFKRKWIDKREDHNALYLHFAMTDNPSLSKKTLDRYESMYTGVFYDRYVRGLWVAAEGLVYPMFNKAEHVFDELPWHAKQRGKWYISLDYGTVNPTAAGLWCVYHGTAYRAAEYYYDSRAENEEGVSINQRRTDEEHYAEIEKMAGDRRIERIVVDPSAASFKETIRRHGKFAVWDADNSVLDGIRLTGTLLKAGRILVHSSCKGFLSEVEQYQWDMEKTDEDAVIKENDHAMDDTRYFASTIMSREVRGKEL